MYADITPAAKRTTSPARSRPRTTTRCAPPPRPRPPPRGRPTRTGTGASPCRCGCGRSMWGTLSLPMTVAVVSIEGSPRVEWTPSATFPGVTPGASLTRHTTLPRRATLLARDGKVLAESPPEGGAGREHPLGEGASAAVGEIGAIPAPRRRALEAEGVPGDAEVGNQRPGARPRRPAARAPRRRASRGREGARVDPSPRWPRRAHDDLRAGAGSRGRRARRHRPARWDHRDAAGLRPDPRGRRHRPGRSAAARLDVQDHHPLGGARRTRCDAPHDLPLRDLRDARRRAPEQRERRGMRRLARTRLRGLVQLGVHAPRSQDRGAAARGDGRTLRLQPAARRIRRRTQQPAVRRCDPGRTGRWLHRHRAG